MTASALTPNGWTIAEGWAWPGLTRRLNSPNHGARMVQRRVGIMLHYDDSSGDGSAVEWFSDPTCRVSYNLLILHNGDAVEIVGPHLPAYHAGTCKQLPGLVYPNNALYGVAIAGNATAPATPEQVARVVEVCVAISRAHGWADASQHIWGHCDLAVYGPNDTKITALWGKGGRKVDPIGPHPDAPILDTLYVQHQVSAVLRGDT